MEVPRGTKDKGMSSGGTLASDGLELGDALSPVWIRIDLDSLRA